MNNTPTVLTKSARSVIIYKAIGTFVVGLISLVLLYFLFFGPERTMFGTIVIIAFASIFLAVTRSALRDLQTARANKDPFRVEITNDALTWTSPLPNQFASFAMELDQIDRVLTVYRSGSRAVIRFKYYIISKDGAKTRIDPEKSGIHPAAVFDALVERGIFHEEQTRS